MIKSSSKLLVITGLFTIIFCACKKNHQDEPITFKPYNPTVNFRVKSVTAKSKGISISSVNYIYNNGLIDSIISYNGFDISKSKMDYTSDEVILTDANGFNTSLSFDKANHIIHYSEAYGLVQYSFTYKGDRLQSVSQYFGSSLLHQYAINYTNNQPTYLEGHEYLGTDSFYEKRDFTYENGLLQNAVTNVEMQGYLMPSDSYKYYYSNGLLNSVEISLANNLTDKDLFEYDSNGLVKKYIVVDYSKHASGDTITNMIYDYEVGKGNMRELINPYDKLMGFPFPI